MTPEITPDRWRVVDFVVQAALERDIAERPAFLARACGSDAALRREVESLLAAAAADGFLECPPSLFATDDASGMSDSSPPLARLTAALAGRYAVEHELGQGGMATVYLARDVRHRRPVAVKVLHPELSAALGPERFLREIEFTASLQHPHILPLFDSGTADGLLYYVMPYVEGESLRARLARERQLPVDDAVRLAREIADALAYAHARGVVHRDVKPENVLLQGGSHALMADFGIALAVAQAGGARMTQTGLSIGTPQYMAPEQAMGERAVDARADVYALGAVLYEMLAGEPPFTGPTAQAVVARVMTEAPRSLEAQRPSVPPHVEAAIMTALARLPADRFQSAAAFASALVEPAFGRGGATPGASVTAPRAARLRRMSRGAVELLAAGALVVAVSLGWTVGRAPRQPADERGPVRFAIEVDSGSLGTSGPAISPDGRAVVYAVEGADGARLYARRVDDLAARPLAGTEGGEQPFFSLDGAWVAFYAHGALRKVRLDGGSAVVVTDVPPPAKFGGGSWGRGDTIIYAVLWSNALYRVSAGGGVASRVPIADTTVEVTGPHLLPGGRAALVTTTPAAATTGQRVGVLDLASGRLRRFGPGVAPHYVAGTLVYASVAGELYRQPFDDERREPTGAAEQIATGVAFLMGGAAPFNASPTGTLVYRVGGSQSSAANLKLTLRDRTGRELQMIPARMPWAPRFSPDGRRVAYGANAPGRDSSDLWVTDLESGGTQRLTADANENNDPHWSPDGKRVAYSANAAGAKDLFVRALDGGRAVLLTRRPGYQFPADWVADGSAVLFVDVPLTGGRSGNQDLWVQPTDGRAARSYLATPAREIGARASPDGRWVAYTSDETGRDEVYVESYPTPGRRTLVSARGGIHPVWRRDGRELYYWQADQLVAARVDATGAGGPPTVRAQAPLFRAPYPGGVGAMYDASPDGKRFILVVGYERASRLVVALDALGAGRPRARAGR